jgi:hypothetical protein
MLVVRIKKYANRKLYDEEASVYLSLLDISNLAAVTSNIRVMCDRTGRDITLETLSRALYERLKLLGDAEDGSTYGGAAESDSIFPFTVASLTKLIAKVKIVKKTSRRKNARSGVKKSSGSSH